MYVFESDLNLRNNENTRLYEKKATFKVKYFTYEIMEKGFFLFNIEFKWRPHDCIINGPVLLLRTVRVKFGGRCDHTVTHSRHTLHQHVCLLLTPSLSSTIFRIKYSNRPNCRPVMDSFGSYTYFPITL